jgi:hypothetical protein
MSVPAALYCKTGRESNGRLVAAVEVKREAVVVVVVVRMMGRERKGDVNDKRT